MRKSILHLVQLYFTATVAFLIFSFSSAIAATRTALANGSWTNTSTWSGGVVPVSGDDVIIPAGITVTFNNRKFNTAHTYIEVGGRLDLGAGQEVFGFSASVSFRVLNGGELRNASTDATSGNYFFNSTILEVNTGVTLKVYIETGGKYTIRDAPQIIMNDADASGGAEALLPVSSGTQTTSFMLVGFDYNTDPDLVGVELYTAGITAPVPGGVLPIKLQNFNVVAVNGAAHLTWQTSFEQNSRFFEAEHSLDGQVWTKAGTVNAAGSSASILKYTYVHTDAAAGRNHYRLKMVDQDGSSKWSAVASVSLSRATNLRVYPQPATDHVIVELSASGISQPYIITNAQGSMVKRGFITKNKQSINTQELTPGIYVLKVNNLGPVQFLKK